MRMLSTVVVFLVTAALSSGCKPRRDNLSDTKELVAETTDQNAKNILVMSAARVLEDSEMYHYRKLLGQMKSAFFEVAGNSRLNLVEGYQLTREQILSTLETTARDVGENGTLIWYMSSHGMGGKLRSFDKMTIESQELVDAIRRGRKGLGPIRRLYMFFDYCNAEVSASDFIEGMKKPSTDEVAAAAPLDLMQLSNVYPEEEALRTAFGRVGPDASGGLALQGDEPLFKEALIYSVSPREQVTSRYGFAEAMKASLAEITPNPKTTLAEFLGLLSKHIAKTEQVVSGSSPETKAPQRAVFFALPDNQLLKETLFGHTARNYVNPNTPCPPWFSRSWTHNRSRDSNGRCYSPESLCKCYMAGTDVQAGQCTLRFPDNMRMAGISKKQNQQDKEHNRPCYSTCLEIAAENVSKVANYCKNTMMTINALDRLEVWNVAPKR